VTARAIRRPAGCGAAAPAAAEMSAEPGIDTPIRTKQLPDGKADSAADGRSYA